MQPHLVELDDALSRHDQPDVDVVVGDAEVDDGRLLAVHGVDEVAVAAGQDVFQLLLFV